MLVILLDLIIRLTWLSLQVFGYHHPKTKRARDTLERPRYAQIQQLMQLEDLRNQLEQQMALNENQ